MLKITPKVQTKIEGPNDVTEPDTMSQGVMTLERWIKWSQGK